MLLLGVLLVQTLTLDGAADGVAYYIGKFDHARLVESEARPHPDLAPAPPLGAHIPTPSPGPTLRRPHPDP